MHLIEDEILKASFATFGNRWFCLSSYLVVDEKSILIQMVIAENLEGTSQNECATS